MRWFSVDSPCAESQQQTTWWQWHVQLQLGCEHPRNACNISASSCGFVEWANLVCDLQKMIINYCSMFVQAEAGSKKQASKFLDLLARRPQKAFSTFIYALVYTDQEHVACMLNRTLTDRHVRERNTARGEATGVLESFSGSASEEFQPSCTMNTSHKYSPTKMGNFAWILCSPIFCNNCVWQMADSYC